LSNLFYSIDMIKRAISEKLKYLASKFPVVSIVGPRQSGKTTLVKSVFPEMHYASLEDLDLREFAIKDPRGFLATYKKGVIIDEIQRAPQLFSYIQTAVDKINKNKLFILTGSQNFLVQENISQSLAGRTAILKLLPFSVSELKNTSHKLRAVEDYLFKGFYPRLYDKKISPMDWYPNYIQAYIERDVRMIKNISNLNVFQKFVKLCAGRAGQILNLSSLGNDCGVTHNTAKAWISILEASYIIFLLKPYYKNFNKRLVKMPKLYFYDTGLICSLLDIHNKRQLETHYLKGGLFESFVISEIMKYQLNKGLEPRCYYWRDKTGKEIDCIAETSDSLLQIEIKSSKTIAGDFFDNFKYWTKLVRQERRKSYLIYSGDENQKRSLAEVIGWRDIDSIFN